MTKYKFTMEEQQKIDGRFYTQEVKQESIKTDGELEQATCPETMRFFRRGLGSKQEILRHYTKDGREIVDLFSYCPFDLNKRTRMRYEEMKE